MAEGTENTGERIEKRIERTRLNQAYEIQMETVSSSYVWDCHREEHEGINEENIKEHVEECLGGMLNNYIEDERNYALNGAVISCDRMSDRKITIEFMKDRTIATLEGEKINEVIFSEYKKPMGVGPDNELQEIPSHVGEKNIRKLFAALGNSQTANGIRFATVADRSCLREKLKSGEGVLPTSKKNGAKALGVGMLSGNSEVEGNMASIVSCGNCMNLGKNDMEKIVENWEGVLKYGTCYALIQPASKWENPYCMESVTGECKKNEFMDSFSGFDMVSRALEYAICAIEHHRPMRFSTIKGEKEGLTMMSTLLCGKGGIITIEASGQIYIEPKAKDIEVVYEFKYDWAKEGLPNSKYITPEFLERVVEIAKELEIDPDDLMAVMAFESWLDPQMDNPLSGAYGLIQFTEVSLAEINKTNGTAYKKNDIPQMSALEQLELVYLHYKPKTGLMHDLGDVYLVTFAPGFVTGEILDDSVILYSKSDGKKYEQNSGLDKDGKGYITKGDAVQVVIDRREKYQYESE